MKRAAAMNGSNWRWETGAASRSGKRPSAHFGPPSPSFSSPCRLSRSSPVYEHAPWLNDPYDTLYSFAMFLVPLATAFFLLQVSLCRKVGVLPAERGRSVLGGCRVAAIVISATLASCWV